MEKIGEFEITSGTMLATDPSYKKGKPYVKVIQNVKPGKWKAYIDMSESEKYCSRLAAYHENFASENVIKNERCNCGVDSGLFGFFDEDHYNRNTFREVLRKIGSSSVAIIPCGCTASSGYGDGVYPVKIFLNGDDEVIGIEVEFISQKHNEQV